MHLAYVAIRDYRGIRQLELTLLREITTLIGENAYGKSNLLDALLVCLGPGAEDDRFAFLPDDFTPSTPIGILLGFRESRDGEWDDPAFAPLRAGIHRGPAGERRIELRVLATHNEKSTADGTSVATSLVDTAGGPLAPGSADLIRLLRRRVPVVALKADRFFVHPSRAHASGPTAIETTLEREVAAAYDALLELHSPTRDERVRRGFEAARTYVERFGGGRMKERVRSFLGPSTGGTGVSGAARSIALLLVLGGLLDVRAQDAFGPDAEPVVVIEDVEAYLHPTVLAAAAAVIGALPAQKILTTNSGELISMVPLLSLRRLVRRAEVTETYRLRRGTLHDDELRRIAYHVKANRGGALFARAWMLVEGETEFWLLPELAETLGYDFALEGIRMMEFAQSGVDPLVKLADDLGIEWHLLADGDASGRGYIQLATSFLRGRPADRHISALSERDIEHTLWSAGYADVYRRVVAAAMPDRFLRRPRTENPTPTIERALRARSKPGMALAIADAARLPGNPGVPPSLRHAIEATVKLARASVGDVSAMVPSAGGPIAT